MPASITLGRAAPTIAVAELERALEFYVGLLGLEVTFENGDPRSFIILVKDAAELHLTLEPGHAAAAHNVAHLLVGDARALYEHLQENGVEVIKAIRDADYGVRGFVVADPDGNRIDVGQNLEGSAT